MFGMCQGGGLTQASADGAGDGFVKSVFCPALTFFIFIFTFFIIRKFLAHCHEVTGFFFIAIKCIN